MFAWFLAVAVIATDPSPSGAADRQGAVIRSLRGPKNVTGVRFTLEERMRDLRVAGCAIAVVHGFEIDWVAGFGERDASTREPVTADTMFQAGSISKPVFATAVHRLAQDEQISLDEDVRKYLSSWQLPENEFSKAETLTVRHLLSHTGSVTVHGFLGYSRAEALPTVPQILSGESPANSPAVFMDGKPGTFRYAGGGTTIVQLAVADKTGKSIPSLVDELVFRPLAMNHATYEQPLPTAKYPDHAAGHLDDGQPVYGKFQVHPELGAAGLWISARDLATLLREWLLAANGKSERVLSRTTMENMLKPVGTGGTSAGFFIETHAGTTYFQHGGSNVGFKNMLYGCADSGDGFVFLSNTDPGGALIIEVHNAIAEVYGWAGFGSQELAESAPTEVELEDIPGRYELGDDLVATVFREGNRLFVRLPPNPARPLHRIGERSYLCLDRDLLREGDVTRFDFEEPEDGVCEGLNFASGSKKDYALRADEELSTAELAAQGDVAGAVANLRARHRALREGERAGFEEAIDRMIWSTLAHGDLKFARAAAELQVELYPESVSAHATLGRVAQAMGDRATLRNSCERLVEIGGRPGVDSRSYPITAAKAFLTMEK